MNEVTLNTADELNDYLETKLRSRFGEVIWEANNNFDGSWEIINYSKYFRNAKGRRVIRNNEEVLVNFI